MPIPQVKKKKHKPQQIRDASAVRRKRAAVRKGKKGRTIYKKQNKKDSPDNSRPRKKGGFKEAFQKDRIVKTLGLLTLTGFGLFLIIVGIAFAWVSKDLASIEDVEKRALDQSTKIYARDGVTLLYELGDNKRNDVDLDQIDKKIQQATIALEDKRFYEHSGLDAKALLRAVLAARGVGSARGTSTLTQQFVKNAILSNERTYTRKMKEALLSFRLEQKYSKDEILNMYLNEVYYGAIYQGIETASREYFGKSANDVTLAEAATLASLPKDPVRLPRDPERLKIRRDYALDLMTELEFITKEEANSAKQVEVPVYENVSEIKAPHFVFYVREFLDNKFGQTTIRKGGLKVITTLDWDKQQKAQEAIENGIPKIEQYGGSNAALVSVDTHTGQILAMVGSRDFFDKEHDGQVNVTTSLRQPGSSFKPLVYLTAFDKGYTPETRLYDLETDFLTEAEGKYHPRNYNLSENGPVTLRYALSQSLNIPAVKLLYLVGVNSALDMAEQLGYTSLKDRSRFGLSLVLGGAEVTLLEHVSAFATFAREGEHHPPAAILEIQDNKGKTIEKWKSSSRKAVDSKAARTLNSVLSDAASRGGSFAGLNLSDRQVAAKTGTTNDYRDAWTIGYTPSISTGVWTGNNDNTEMRRGAAGLVIAAPIWKSYMESVLSGTVQETFKAPSYRAKTEVLGGNLDNYQTYSIDSTTNQIIPDSCLDSYPKKYVTKKEFKETHTILYYLDKFYPTGGAPDSPRNDYMYEPWETAVVRWTNEAEQQNTYVSESMEEANCNLRNKKQQPTVTIDSLEEGQKYSKNNLIISAYIKPGDNRSIISIKYLIDVVIVDEKQNLNIRYPKITTATYRPKNLTSGKHTVTVQITDDNGNFAEDSVSVVYQ